MSDTKYNVEIKFPNSKRWEYLQQNSSLEWAIKFAQKPYCLRNRNKTRIRKIVKTIMWKSK